MASSPLVLLPYLKLNAAFGAPPVGESQIPMNRTTESTFSRVFAILLAYQSIFALPTRFRTDCSYQLIKNHVADHDWRSRWRRSPTSEPTSRGRLIGQLESSSSRAHQTRVGRYYPRELRAIATFVLESLESIDWNGSRSRNESSCSGMGRVKKIITTTMSRFALYRPVATATYRSIPSILSYCLRIPSGGGRI